jgi:hypothetical protein
MSPLQAALDEYLATRRALGHKLRLPGRLLQRFVTFAEASGTNCITTEIALAWAMQPTKAQPAQWANRLAMVRRLARYCSAIDPRTMVPPADLLPHRYRRPSSPYIYRGEAIAFDERSAAAELCHALRPVRGDRHALQRTAAPRSRRRRSRQWRADSSRHEVWQVALCAAPPVNATRAAILCGLPRPFLPESGQPELLPFRARNAPDRMGGSMDVRQAVPPNRFARGQGFPRAAPA